MDDWKLKVQTSVKLEKRDMFVYLYRAFVFRPVSVAGTRDECLQCRQRKMAH